MLLTEGKIRYSDIERIERFQKSYSYLLNSFSCGNARLDRFFKEEMLLCSANHYITSYCVMSSDRHSLLALFTVSHDIIQIDDNDKEDLLLMDESFEHDDYYNIFKETYSFPAINVCHLGVSSDIQRKGIGTLIINYLKYTYASYDSAGCQFITADAIKNNNSSSFYSKCGFSMLSLTAYESTVRMYYFLRHYQTLFSELLEQEADNH